MWFLTIGPFIRISVFIAKLSKRQYCWRVFEDFHSQEEIQFFDIHCCFTIGGYDYRRTARFRQGIHFSIDAPESTTNSRSSSFRVDAGRHLFSEGEKNVALSCSFKSNTPFGQLPRCFAGHLALATLSPPETDPQILESWGCPDEVHLGKSIRAKDLVSNFSVTCNSLREFHTLDWFLHVCALP